MKTFLVPFILAMSFLIVHAVPVFAEANQVEAIVDLLQQAKDAGKPVPLLEKALSKLRDFDPVPKSASGNKNKKGKNNAAASANKAGATDHKKKAVDAINDAITAAKSGDDAKAKITHAIAMTHEAGNLKH